MTDLATLFLKVDSREVATARKELEELAKTGGKTEKTVTGSTKQVGAATRAVANDVTRHTQTMKRDFLDLGKIMTGPSSPFIAPVRHAPAATGAMRAVAGAAGMLGGVMGGAVAAGVTLASAALLDLIGNMFKAEDAVGKIIDEMKRKVQQTKDNEKANEIWKKSLDGVEESIRANEAAMRDHIQASKTFAQIQLENTTETLKNVKARQMQTIAALEAAKAQSLLSGAMVTGGTSGAMMARTANASQVAQIEAELVLAKQKLARAEKGQAEARSMRLAEIMRADMDFMKKPARTTRTPLTGENPVTLSEVGQLLKQVAGGGTVTSTTGGKHVAGSYHYRGQAVDFVPKGGMGSASKGEIRAAAEAAGIKVLELLGPGDKGHSKHFHLAFGKQRQDGSRLAARQERSAEREAEERLRNSRMFEDHLQQKAETLLDLRTRQVTGTDELVRLEMQQIEAARKAADLATARMLKDGEIDEAKAKLARSMDGQIEQERKAALAKRTIVEKIDERSNAEQRRMQYLVDDLRFTQEMASGTAEQRRIQLQIIDSMFEQRRLHLEAEKSKAMEVGNIQRVSDLNAELARMPTQRAQDRARAVNGTKNPLEVWGEQFERGRIADELQDIQVRGLDGISSAISGIITGTQSMKSAFKDLSRSIVADIIQMTVRMMVFRALSSAFPGMFGGGPVTTYGGSISATNFGANLLGRANGGPVQAGMPYIVGEKRPELFVPKTDGVILPRVPGRLANNNAPIELIIHSAPSPDAWATIDTITAHRAGEAVKVSIAHSEGRLKHMTRTKLG